MTIKLRERLFWSLFAISVMAMLAAAATIWYIGLGGIERVRAMAVAPAGFYVILGSALACGLYAAVVCGVIAFRSGKTVSVEMFLFSLWVFCQSFELAKVASMALMAHGAGTDAFEFVTRVALFGRYCAAVSVFAGSLFAVGLKQERGLPIFVGSLLLSLFFSSIHPLNSVGPGRDFLADRGLMLQSRIFELSFAILAAIDYGIAWRIGKDKAYLVAGLGLILCVASSYALKTATSPVPAALGVVGLLVGTGMCIKSLHDHYLWR